MTELTTENPASREILAGINVLIVDDESVS